MREKAIRVHTERGGPAEKRQSNRRILTILFFGVLVAALDIAIVGPVLPALQEHFGVSSRLIPWVLNIYVLFNLVGVPLMAKLGDAFGRRTIFAVDLVIFSSGCLVVAFSANFSMLLAGRGLQGLGAAGLFPIASAVVGDRFRPESRGRALGLLGSVFGLAFIIGPTLSGILLQYSWRWPFLAVILPASVAFVGGLWVLPSNPSVLRGSFDWRGLVLVTAGIGSLAFGLNGIRAEALLASLSSARVAPFLAGAIAVLALFTISERRVADPLIRVDLFRQRQVGLTALLTICTGFCEAAIIFIPKLAVEAFGVSGATASFMFLPLAAAVAVGSPTFGRLIDRYGSRVVVATCGMILTAGLLTLAAAPLARTTFYGGCVLIGLALSGLLGSAFNYIILHEARVSERSAAQGIITLCVSVGVLLGGAAVGSVAASGETELEGLRRVYWFVSAVALIIVLTSSMLKSRRQETTLQTRN